MENHDKGSTAKITVTDDPMNVHSEPRDGKITTVNKLKVTWVLLINNVFVILFMVMLYYVLPSSSVSQAPGSTGNAGDNQVMYAQSMRSKALPNGTEVPLGTISAWIPSPNPAWIPALEVPMGWQICNGSIISDNKSPWVGQNTPNLTDRFLRGGDFNNFLTYQEDQIHDHGHLDRGHTHVDPGHSHSDTGHTHNDPGHTHTDAGHTHTDQGHTHTDGGHTHTDAGHSHGYVDAIVYRGSSSGWGAQDDDYDYRDESKTTSSASANIQTSYAVISGGNANITTTSAVISTNQANLESASAAITTTQVVLSNATSNIAGVVDASAGSETRPKAAYIFWIMKVFEPV